MLMRPDPFRELDRLTQQFLGSDGTLARPSAMPLDAWRDGETFSVEFDLPGVSPDSIDTGRIEAGYDGGVLTLRIPVAEHAKPRKIEISSATTARPAIGA